MIDLKSYFQDKYKGGENFIENVIRPIFGKDKYEDAYEEDVLENNPEWVKMARSTGLSKILHLGTIHIPMNPTEVFDITVDNHVQMRRNRVTVQQLIRRIMSTYSSAFMVFHYNDEDKCDWRFTFCSKQGNNKESTDSKRYTFLLGPGQSCRTAADNFKKLVSKGGNIELKDIVNAFDVEALSNEFFDKYKEQYEKFVMYITGKKFVKKNGGWKEKVYHEPHPQLYTDFGRDDKRVRDYVKKLLGRIVFLHYLQKKGWLGVEPGNEWNSGNKEFMYDLFVNSSEEQQSNFLDEVLEPLFHDALDTDRSSNGDLYDTKVIGLPNHGVLRFPYLNGGLFGRDEDDDISTVFPAEYFNSLFTMFHQYNFTIDENDPHDAEVGIDPEMLGQIFENLLEDNKDKGAYYTPKEIVRYMCRESLIAYLQTDVTDEPTREALRQFVTSHDVAVLGGRNSALALNVSQCLKDVKICDPAIGSGAFPMGLLNELFLCRGVIEDLDNAAAIKRHIIEQNIFGVDIEKGAVEIARLRFWLSLITDADKPDVLPNMDFKIMQGNSLLEQYKGFDLSHIMDTKTEIRAGHQFNMFETQIDVIRAEVKDAIKRYYSEQNHDMRHSMRQGIQQKIQQQIAVQGINVDISDIKDIAANDQFFLWHTWFSEVFEENGGFDIVIGNPPYGAKLSEEDKNLYRKVYSETQFKIDTYSLFVLQALDLQKDNGVCYYIIPNTFLDNYFEEQVRCKLLNNKVVEINDLTDKVFASAVVHSMIFAFGKSNSIDNYLVKSNSSKELSKDFVLIEKAYFESQPQHSLSIGSYSDYGFYKKLHNTSKKLVEVLDIRQAIKTGNDKVHITDICVAENYKPILRGKDIQKYVTKDPHLYVNYGKHLACPRSASIFEQPKILIREAGSKITATYDENNYYIMSSLYNAILIDNDYSLKYLLALINSTLFQYLMYKLTFEKTEGAFTKAKIFHYYELPVKIQTRSEQQPIIILVDRILEAKKLDPQSDTSALEAEINRLVYALYGLTEDEIKIVEGNN